MKLVVKRNRELALINARNTQNENRAETIELVVPEEYENYNKKIVFITPDGAVWDVITDNKYKLTNAITKYGKVDFYIWLTKEVDGESIDFRTKTKTLNFYHNEDASDEITDEEIHGVNTVVNLLEEEIEKVENLNIEATKIGNTTTVTITKKDGTTESVEINDGTDGQDGQDGYTPQKGIDYFTEQDIEEIEGDILNEVYTKSETDTLLQEKADVEDIPDVSSFITKDVNNLTYYTLKTNTGSLIDLEINDTTYVVTLKLKTQDGTIISTDTIDLPLESVVVSGRYDNTTKKVILTLENGSEVDFSVADLVAGLQTEITSQNKLASDLVDDTNSGNKFVTTSEKQTWNNKLDESDLTDYVKNTDYATSSKGGTIKQGGGLKVDANGAPYANVISSSDYNSAPNSYFISKGTLENVIAGKQLINQTQLEESQETQDDEIEALQTENARLKATLPTTTGTGQDITLDKTAEFEFIKPPLPRGNTKQDTTTGKNLLPPLDSGSLNGLTFTTNSNGITTISGTTTSVTTYFKNVNKILPAGTYTLSINLSYTPPANSSQLILQDINNVRLATINLWKITSKTFTLSADTEIKNYYLFSNSGIQHNGTISIQLEKGSTATSYEPYTNGASPNPDYPQEITNVTGDVEVVVENKNLFDGEIELGGINPGDGSLVSNNNRTRSKNFIKVKPNTTYYYTRTNIGSYRWIVGYTKNKTGILDGNEGGQASGLYVSSQNAKTFSFTTSDTTEYVKWYDVASTNVTENVQIEQGSATDYTPHKEQVLPLTLGNIELCKIGDYQDYFWKDETTNKWYLHKEIGEYTIPNNVGGYNSASNWYYIGIGQFSNIKTNSGTEILCNYLQNINLALDANIDKSGIYNIGTHIVLRNIDLSSTSDYQTWISNNKILYSLLATPTDTEITDTTLISQLEAINNTISYEEQTNISNNQIALFNVEAYQSTKLVLEEMATAIVALGGV